MSLAARVDGGPTPCAPAATATLPRRYRAQADVMLIDDVNSRVDDATTTAQAPKSAMRSRRDTVMGNSSKGDDKSPPPLPAKDASAQLRSTAGAPSAATDNMTAEERMAYGAKPPPIPTQQPPSSLQPLPPGGAMSRPGDASAGDDGVDYSKPPTSSFTKLTDRQQSKAPITFEAGRSIALQFILCYAPEAIMSLPGCAQGAVDKSQTEDDFFAELYQRFKQTPVEGEAAAVYATDPRTRLFIFYAHYEPGMLPRVDDIAHKYAGQTAALMRALCNKYGPEPQVHRLFEVGYVPQARGASARNLTLTNAAQEPPPGSRAPPAAAGSAGTTATVPQDTKEAAGDTAAVGTRPRSATVTRGPPGSAEKPGASKAEDVIPPDEYRRVIERVTDPDYLYDMGSRRPMGGRAGSSWFPSATELAARRNDRGQISEMNLAMTRDDFDRL